MKVTDDASFRRAQQHALNGQYDDALLLLHDVVTRFPTDPNALKELGLAYALRGDSLLPLTLKDRASSASDDGSAPGLASAIGGAVQAALGLAIVRASQMVGSTDWIVRYRSDFRNAIDNLASAAGRFDEAGSPNAEVYFVLAQCLRQLGRVDEARIAARKASELAPNVAAYAAHARLTDSLTGGGIAGDRQRPTWADVVLPAKTKRELRQMQLMLEDPSLAKSLGVEPPTGLLLYGPPGTGKTTIARVLASEARCKFFATSPAEVNSMWLGESEKQVKKLFDQARAAAPSIIFLDEIDALLPSRSGGVSMYSDKVVNQFLHEMDGLRMNRGVFVVGATNRRDMLDPALLRGGRLSREIEIPLPDSASRRAMFELYLRGTSLSDDVSLDTLEERSDGFSGATIRAVINEAGLQALIRLSEAEDAGNERPAQAQVTMADFDEALSNFTASRSAPNPTPYDSIRRLFPGN